MQNMNEDFKKSILNCGKMSKFDVKVRKNGAISRGTRGNEAIIRKYRIS